MLMALAVPPSNSPRDRVRRQPTITRNTQPASATTTCVGDDDPTWSSSVGRRSSRRPGAAAAGQGGTCHTLTLMGTESLSTRPLPQPPASATATSPPASYTLPQRTEIAPPPPRHSLAEAAPGTNGLQIRDQPGV